MLMLTLMLGVNGVIQSNVFLSSINAGVDDGTWVNTSLKFYQSGRLVDSNNVRQEKGSSNLYSISFFVEFFPSLQ